LQKMKGAERYTNKVVLAILIIASCIALRAVAEEPVVSMDDEPHYSRVFNNTYCRAYMVSLNRLEETKPVAHDHDWVRMTLGGTVEQAWGGTVFSQAGYEDPDGYFVSFLYPVTRLRLRNSHVEPYRAMVVEILRGDNSRNRCGDPALDPFVQKLGPGVDPHISYVTKLTKTSVEIMNVQLLSGDTKQLDSIGAGALVVAMTDLRLSPGQQANEPAELQLAKGGVHWLPGPAPAFKNVGNAPGRFVVLEVK
jgi:hypothetical protein